MRATTENIRNRCFTARASLWVLGLFVAAILLVPAGALAGETLTVECQLAEDGSRNFTVTAQMTDASGNGIPNVDVSYYTTPSGFTQLKPTDADGTVVFDPFSIAEPEDYTAYSVGAFAVNGSMVFFPVVELASLSCVDDSANNSSNSVPVYGRSKLNVNRHGFLTLKICGTEEFDVDGVDLRSVSLEGISPRYHKKRDLKGCPGGKDGYKDVKFKFKKRAIVKALMKKVDRKLIDGEVMELEFTGTYNGHADLTALDGELQEGTPIDGTYEVEIVNKSKKKKHWRRWWRNHKKKCAKYYKH